MATARMDFRQSIAADEIAIRQVEERAFGRKDEADLSEALRRGSFETLSLVAVTAEGRIAGHVLFSALEGADRALALAPLSVDPDFQEMQVGTELVRRGLDLAKGAGWRSVFVLGDPGYYARFGFRRELAAGADVPFPAEYFMAIELESGALFGWAGPLRYAPPFDNLE